MIRNIVVTIFLSLAMMTALADNVYPTLEYIKDGEVIETRAMSTDEYNAYMNLKALEKKLEKLEVPLEEFQKNIDVEAKLIEAEARAIVDETMSILASTRSLSDLSRLSVLGDMQLEELEAMLEKMEPMLDEITDMADEISETALEFKTELMKNFDESDIDQIRIIDGNKKNVIIARTNLTIDL